MTEQPTDVADMTVAQLHEHADKNEIDLAGATKKADIVDAITTATEPAPVEPAPVEPVVEPAPVEPVESEPVVEPVEHTAYMAPVDGPEGKAFDAGDVRPETWW